MNSEVENLKIPAHIAIILDGNGRWAKKRFMPRNYGHKIGAGNVEKICEDAYNLGVKYLTVYAFSTENWNRPNDEVESLMKLLNNYLKDSIKKTQKNDMVVRIIGDRNALGQDIKDKITKLEEVSKNNKGLNFTIALNYGGRDEILRAINSIIKDSKEGESIDNIDDEIFESYLDTRDIPNPDLLIRTSGEERISNFLLWQLAYSEFYFTNVLWPDFNKDELIKAIRKYNTRSRRFGGLKDGSE